MHVWAIAFGCVIRWGSFINPGKKFLPTSGVAGTAIAMIMGALVMVILAFSYAYMVPKYPKAGGEFTFTKMCCGKNIAFICGWFLVVAYLTNVPMNSTAIGLIVDGLDGNADILKFGFHYTVAGFDIYMGEMLHFVDSFERISPLCYANAASSDEKSARRSSTKNGRTVSFRFFILQTTRYC